MIYLICFAVSAFLFWLGQNIKPEKREKLFRWLAYGAAILIPVVLAGIRANYVGTDTSSYLWVFIHTHLAFACMDPGYAWLNYIVAQTTGSRIVLFGLIMFLQTLFIFLTLRQWRDKFPIWLGMLIFYLLFFNLSLNAMRQCLALSIAFVGMRYVFERRFFYFSLWVILGFLFHKSILLLLLYYPLFWHANKFTSKKAVGLFIGVGIASIMLLLPFLADFLSSFGGIAQHINQSLVRDNKGFPFNTLIFYSVPALLFFFNREKILSAFNKTGYFFQYIVALLVIIPFMLFCGNDWTIRFSFLITWWLFILIPVIFYSYDNFSKIVLNTAIIAYCFFYWYVTAIYLNHNETAHYATVFGN